MKAIVRTSAINLKITPENEEQFSFVFNGANRVIREHAITSDVQIFSNGAMQFDALLEAPQSIIEQLLYYLRAFGPFVTKPFNVSWRLNDGEWREWKSENIYYGKESKVDQDLEERMSTIQRFINLGHALRNKSKIRVKQPLARILVKVGPNEQRALTTGELPSILLEEINVKKIEFVDDTSQFQTTILKPNFRTIGPKYKKLMVGIKVAIANMTEIKREFEVDGTLVKLDDEDFIMETVEAEGFVTTEDAGDFVALDTVITPELQAEGIMRDFVRAVQEERKSADFRIDDRICIYYSFSNLDAGLVASAVESWREHILSETLATNLCLDNSIRGNVVKVGDEKVRLRVQKNDAQILEGLNRDELGMLLSCYSDGKARVRIGENEWAYDLKSLKAGY